MVIGSSAKRNRWNSKCPVHYLDPNGEYARAFSNENETIKARIFRVGSEESSGEDNTNQLQVPLWFWNSSEWCSFSQAREGAQRPLLRRALREIKNGNDQPDLSDDFVLRRKISSILINLRNQVRKGDNYEGWKLGPKLEVFLVDIISFIELYPSYSTILSRIRDEIDFALNQQNIQEQMERLVITLSLLLILNQ